MWPLFGFHGKFAGWPIRVACCGDIPEQQDSVIAPYRATRYLMYVVTLFCFTCISVKDEINPAVCVFCVCVGFFWGGHSWLPWERERFGFLGMFQSVQRELQMVGTQMIIVVGFNGIKWCFMVVNMYLANKNSDINGNTMWQFNVAMEHHHVDSW